MIKLRTQHILIEMPRTDSEPFIHVTVQRIELDVNGVEINVVDRFGHVYKPLSTVALEVVKYYEPVPCEADCISVFGIADGIKSIATKWIIEKYGGIEQPNGDIYL
tara:strand:- start:11909 stop:12226 length:318 start_codon:yes stop_codon:yes gene_type:complete